MCAYYMIVFSEVEKAVRMMSVCDRSLDLSRSTVEEGRTCAVCRLLKIGE